MAINLGNTTKLNIFIKNNKERAKMEVNEAIINRRSIRKFIDREVSDTDINKILNALDLLSLLRIGNLGYLKY